MQTNGGYYSSRSSHDPRYESYDGSDYGSNASMERKSTGPPWDGIQAVHQSTYNPYDYSNTVNGHASFHSDMPPAVPRGSQDVEDEVGLHLLYENALMDSQAYSILSISEVDALKKEHGRLASRLDGINRKLALESKVKDAAQNLHRLYLVGNAKGRPDTPQSPPSPRRSRGSLLGEKNGESIGASNVPHTKTLHKAEDELTSSIKVVDELHEVYKTLLERKAEVERQLLSHTAAVLAEQSNKTKSAAASEKLLEGEHDSAAYEPDEFDSIRDILHGKPRQTNAAAASPAVDQSEQFAGIQKRLEELNDQLRAVIEDASRSRGVQAEPDLELDDATDDISSRLDRRFTKLEYNIRALQQEQEDLIGHHTGLQEELRSRHDSEKERWQNQHLTAEKSAALQQSVIEEQLATINHKLHSTLLLGSDMPDTETLRAPPEATGEGYQQQLEYLDDSVDTVQQMLQSTNKATSLTQKDSEYEETLAGLWDIMQDEETSWSGDGTSAGLRQDFSLAAFSARVQNLHDRATCAAQQHEILRRQIQQQREISGDSEEKDRQISDLQARHTQLWQAHEEVQDQLAEVMAKHAQAETEASRSRTELDNVAKEFEELQKAIDAREKERDEMARQLKQHKINSSATEDLESEVVRLTTELTMAKAELDAAAGSRSERAAAQAQAADASRSKELEQELEEMTTEFQELTRESVELEKEREQLDALVDQLRERCEALEAQISDDRVKWMGSNMPRSPTGPENGREATSVAIMRQEFKKMVRETRAEGFKALKLEQEERRRLEAEVRRLRQANGPLAKANGIHSTALASPSVT